MKQVSFPVLTIPDDAKAALKPIAKVKPPVHPQIIRAANQQMRSMMFGKRMQPSIRERLLHYSSFRALLSGRRA